MEEENPYDKYRDEFHELDKKEYGFLGKQLALFKEAMQDHGFENEQAMELTAQYTKFIFDMGVEEFMNARIDQWDEEDDLDLDEEDLDIDVDDEEDIE